jgi:beta-aspartyl-peptidase (threonine type)
MKSIFLTTISFAFIIVVQFVDLSGQPASSENYTIVLHGGAVTFKSLPDSVIQSRLNSLSEALKLGQDILKDGGTSLDAVERVVKFLEDDPKFNAGKGAVYTSAGTHELDASIMNGKDLSTGAVTLIKHVKNPISLARLVMEKTPHVLLGGEGAEEFAKQMASSGLEIVPNEYFDTPQRYEELKRVKHRDSVEVKGTVGCVALDKFGNLAAATSTGGRTNKMPGRIGDSPLINAGTYANNKTCAVSGTGIGEEFIRHTIAYNVSALMEYKNMSLQEAADEVVFKILKKGDGGVIAVDKEGNYTMTFNTTGMFRGVANSGGVFEVKIWE